MALVGFLGLAFATSSLTAAEPEIPVLEPTSDWVLDYADERCTLTRLFGEAGQLGLRIDSFGSWTRFQFTIMGNLVPAAAGPTGEIRARFTHDSDYRHLRARRGTSGSYPAVSFDVTLAPVSPGSQTEGDRPIAARLADPALAQLEQRTESLRLEFPRRTTMELKLGSMGTPMRALRDCVDDLYRSWDLEPDREKSLSRAASPTTGTIRWLQERYPSRASDAGMNAFVPVRVMVDATGKASNCVVQSEVVDEQFRKAVCQGLSRSFRPALDQLGNPVDSVFHTSVIYLLSG